MAVSSIVIHFVEWIFYLKNILCDIYTSLGLGSTENALTISDGRCAEIGY
jgi:hypothetical protein